MYFIIHNLKQHLQKNSNIKFALIIESRQRQAATLWHKTHKIKIKTHTDQTVSITKFQNKEKEENLVE